MSQDRILLKATTRMEYVEKHLGIPMDQIISIVKTEPKQAMKHKANNYNYYEVKTCYGTSFLVSIFKKRDVNYE